MKHEDIIQLIAGVAIALIQFYAIDPTFSFAKLFARMWDWLARTSGNLANWLGWYSMHARENYYMAVNSLGT